MLVLMTDRMHAQIHLLLHHPSSFLLPLPGTQREDWGARTQRPTGKTAHTRRATTRHSIPSSSYTGPLIKVH